jgi:transposase
MRRSAELSEAAWTRIEPLMPQAEGRSRPWRDRRQVVEGIVFRYRTGVRGVIFPSGSARGRRCGSGIIVSLPTGPGTCCE